jgi:hypothetical protein
MHPSVGGGVLGVARYRHEAGEPDPGTVVAEKHE